MNVHLRNGLIALTVAGILVFGLDMPRPGVAFGVFLFYILWNVSGNRKTATASAEQKERALTLEPPPGQALVYVIRKGFVAKAAGVNVLMDGTPRAHLKSPQFTCFAMPPGTYDLSAAFAGGAGFQSRKRSEQVTLVADKAVGVLITPAWGLLRGAIGFEMMTGHQLKDTIWGMTMVAPVEA